MRTRKDHEELTPDGSDRRKVGAIGEVELANRALCALNEALDRLGSGDSLSVGVGNETAITLPRSVAETLRIVLANSAAGQAVTVVPSHAEFTTQQAADILNVSRPYLIKLLDDEQMDYRMVGTHRRIQASSLHAYQRKMEIESKHAADELSQLTEELGLY